MKAKDMWEEFVATGTIDSYMRYKGIAVFEMENKAVESSYDGNIGINN